MSSLRISLCTALALPLVGAAASPQYGIDAPAAIGPYLNGVFPSEAPGSADDYDLTPAFPALTFRDPIVIRPHPNEATMFVATREGEVFAFDEDPNVATKRTFLDLRDRCAVVWDGGMLGFTPHPNFGIAGAASNDEVFAYYCYTPTGSYPTSFVNGFFDVYLRLSRFTVPAGADAADPDSEEVMMQLRLFNGSHRGGDIAFGPDGMLYVPIGDQFRFETAQDIAANLEGGVHRLDVDRDASRSHPPVRTLPQSFPDEVSGVGYWIPNDNPFLDAAGGRFEEYWSLGHRNPHRMTFDSLTGELWIGEVGESEREEVNVVEPGGNYGWPFREGLVAGPRTPPQTIEGTLTDPVYDFTRSDTAALIGGYVYRGSINPGLVGSYICGGYASDRVFAVAYDVDDQEYGHDEVGRMDPGDVITFGESRDGELFVGRQNADTTLYMLVGTNPGPEPPQLLSALGAFTDLQTLDPAPGLIPYDLQAPFWSDGAEKARWAAIPNDGIHDSPNEQVVFDPRGNDWTFPPGAVTVKHFELAVDDTDPSVTRRLETRFVVFTDEGFYAVSYHWLPDGSDAVLANARVVEEIDIETPLGTRTQTWTFPSRSDCRVCHASETGGALGLRTHQLNGEIVYPGSGVFDNQLRTWNHLGIFAGGIDESSIADLPRAAALRDGDATLGTRARSYLDSNCAHCHRPDTGTRAVFDARFATPLYATDLLFGSLSSDLGITGAQVVAPRDAHRSVALLRAGALDGTAMPPLAKSLVDVSGVELLTDWVRNLEASEHRRLGNAPERLGTLNSWTSNLVIDESDVYTNTTGRAVELRLEAFRFWADQSDAPITPFVVQVNGDNDFVVRSVGATRVAGEYLLGHNAFAYGAGAAPRIVVAPGQSIAAGFLDAYANGSDSDLGAVVPFCECNDPSEVWVTGGPLSGASGSVQVGVPPAQGNELRTTLARDYAFAIDIVILTDNEAPIIEEVPDLLAIEGRDVAFQIVARDAPGDILVYSATGLPDGLTLDAESGAVSGSMGLGSLGVHTATVTVSDGRAEASTSFDIQSGRQPFDRLFAVWDGPTVLTGGLVADASDVVCLDLRTGLWTLAFDGSEIGLGTEIAAMHRDASGELLLAFRSAVDLPGLTGGPDGLRVTAEDVVRFVPSSGGGTAGQFEFVLDGSDLGFLDGDGGARIDALGRMPDGRIAFSTLGRAVLHGTPVRDQDVVAFSGVLGEATAGSVSLVLSGNAIGLGAPGEDVDAVWLGPGGALYFSVESTSRLDAQTVAGPADIVAFDGSAPATAGGRLTSFLRSVSLGVAPGARLRGLSFE